MTERPAIKRIAAEWALLPDGWHQNVLIEVDEHGLISSVSSSSSATSDQTLGVVIPGMINTHSHAFQRKLVGRTQRFTRPEDDFWSWRSQMYKQAELLTPDVQGALSLELFGDMLANGYTTVCEFQYAHGAVERTNAEIPALMSSALIESGKAAGIRTLILPVLYQQAGFAMRPSERHQRPFVLTTPVYLGLIDHLHEMYDDSDTVSIGYAPHSLRAVGYDALMEMLDHRATEHPGAAVHIHVSEQVREVNECALATGRKPIEWLMQHANIDSSWCLIHATHATDPELADIRGVGVTVGLCPTTEADLGDGYFPFAAHVAANGSFSIGSDSNVCVSPCEELRLLDYQSRLAQRKRNALQFDSRSGTGTQLYQLALEGGRRASCLPVGRIETGSFADIVSLSSTHPLSRDRSPDEIMNAYVYSGGKEMIEHVLLGGQAPNAQPH